MAYQLQTHEPIDDGVRRIAGELIDHARAQIEVTDRDRHAAVHEVRKDCKRMRALLRLIRPQAPKLYQHENAFFRDAAASLSGIRDVEAALESYDALLDVFSDEVDRQELAPVRAALTRHKKHLSNEIADLDDRLDTFGAQLRKAGERVSDWAIPGDDPARGSGDALVSGGLAKTYGRGRAAMATAYDAPSVESFHEWRKRAKYLRYQLELLRPAWPRLLQATRKEVKALGDLLGDEHDLAVLEAVLERALSDHDERGRHRVLAALMRQRREQLRDQAYWLGRRIYTEKAKSLRKRIASYWTVARREQRER